MDEKTNSVQAVVRAINILICLNDGTDTIIEIARKCKLSNSTVHRMLKTLEELHCVAEDPFNHHYHPGYLIAQLASNPQTSHKHLVTLANQEMERLAEISKETIALYIQDGIWSIRVHEILSRNTIVVSEEDRVMKMFAGSTARVLLSQFNDEELAIIMDAIKLENNIECSVVNKMRLNEQVNETRRQGYSITRGERVAGAMGITAPIKNYVYPVALSILGIESRLIPKETGFLAELLKSAQLISKNLSNRKF